MLKKLGIPVVRVIDLLGNDDFLPYKADVCVMNELVKNNILENNEHIDSINVHITGQPNLELVIDSNMLETYNGMYHINSYDKVVSFFSQTGDPHRTSVMEALIEMMDRNSNWFCIYKLHPNEDLSFYDQFGARLPQNIIVQKEMGVGEVINLSDIVMTFFSTVGLQAISVDKPLITINLTGVQYLTDYSKYNCSSEVTKIDELENRIKKLLDNNSELSDQLRIGRRKMKCPEKAGQKIAEVVLEVISREK